MIDLIIVVAIVYAMVGLLIAGFTDISIKDYFMPLVGIVLTWPLIIAMLVVLAVCAAPFRLGRKLGAKYLGPILKFFDKIFNG